MIVRRRISWAFWSVVGLLVVAGAVGARYGLSRWTKPTAKVDASTLVSVEECEPVESDALVVRVVRPAKGALKQITSQPGSVQAFESVQMYAKASGYLKSQSVDIGDRVKRGQVVAIVDVPELDKQVQRNAAALEQARARVEQMRAQVASSQADLEATKAAVLQADANAKSSAATLRFRAKQFQRMKELFALKSIDERLVDESQERHEAAAEAEQSAKAAIHTTRAQVVAAQARIRKAEADVVAAEAEVRVAQADLEKSQVMVSFATLTAPFDGVITQRNLSPGDFVRSASEGGNLPLLTVQRVDRMRVVVQVPDRDVPLLDPGDSAVVEIDALPGEQFPAKVSRVAQSEDPQTRLMRIEIDLPNPSNKIRQGMYGRVSIVLDDFAEKLSIPSACLAGKAGRGRGTVFVVRDGKAHRTEVRLGSDNGLRVAVVDGLQAHDQVVVQPGNLEDGASVAPEPADRTPTATRSRQS